MDPRMAAEKIAGRLSRREYGPGERLGRGVTEFGNVKGGVRPKLFIGVRAVGGDAAEP